MEEDRWMVEEWLAHPTLPKKKVVFVHKIFIVY